MKIKSLFFVTNYCPQLNSFFVHMTKFQSIYFSKLFNIIKINSIVESLTDLGFSLNI